MNGWHLYDYDGNEIHSDDDFLAASLRNWHVQMGPLDPDRMWRWGDQPWLRGDFGEVVRAPELDQVTDWPAVIDEWRTWNDLTDPLT